MVKPSNHRKQNHPPRLRAEKHPNWKGEAVGLIALHQWINHNKPRPAACENCGEVKKQKLDAANISGKYKRDLSDWSFLCRRCHMAGDGRMKQLAAIAGEATKIPVLQISLTTGEIIKRWNFIKEAASSIGIHYSNISRCASGQTKSSKGYAWVYDK